VRDDIDSKLNQLMSWTIAHRIMVQTLLGMVITKSQDWRGAADDFRLMTEWSIQNLEWPGPEEESDQIRSDALAHLQSALDDLHDALVRAENGERDPPKK